ncbi:PQQ-binding-like beta-propeller repeat protein [bacterium]|nr:PQQ-binding-like beta-propeller repeat protein [bacterium]
MKRDSIIGQAVAGALLLAASLMPAATAGEADAPVVKGSERHSFYVSDSGRGKVFKFDRDGKLLWECAAPNTYDVCPLPNGNVVFPCRVKGRDYAVREVTPEKKVVWEYRTTGEVFACQRLADGNTVVGECTNARIVEVSPEGKVVKEIKVKVKRGGHGTMRLVRKTQAGTYLVGLPGERVVREYNEAGEVLREIKAPGTAYGAVDAGNGHILFSCQHSVIEVDRDGKEVWKITAKDIPAMGPKWLGSLARLPNGNTVIGNWLGHHQEGKGVPLFEVNRAKQVVWQFTDTVTTRQVTSFHLLD